MKLACEVTVFAGDFASQPLVFAHLMDAAASQGHSPDFDFVEVVQRPFGKRLSAWFADEVVETLEAEARNTLVLFMPGSAFALSQTNRLRYVDTYPATITRALEGEAK